MSWSEFWPCWAMRCSAGSGERIERAAAAGRLGAVLLRRVLQIRRSHASFGHTDRGIELARSRRFLRSIPIEHRAGKSPGDAADDNAGCDACGAGCGADHGAHDRAGRGALGFVLDATRCCVFVRAR